MRIFVFILTLLAAFYGIPSVAETLEAFPTLVDPVLEAVEQVAPVADTGNTAWLLICSALVMLMTPGLAFFYAGMVNRKNVVSTLLQNFVALSVVGLLWVMVGYSLAFSEGNSLIGDMSYFMLNGLSGQLFGDAKVPHYAFVAFQMMFAVITPALITGAIAERVNFKAWMLLLALWSLTVYAPVAHWVWSAKGWIMADGGLDFAGGLVVHVTAGVAGLVASLMFGKRINATEVNRPNDVSMIMLGAALLWFGWFGFNSGSAIASGDLAAHAFMTTFVGAAAAMISWMMVDWTRHSKPSAVGAAIGLVVGLVVITPAAGYVTVSSAMTMCSVSGVICNILSHIIKTKTRMDDALDVFACHGIGGMLGAVMTGLFATKEVNSAIAVEGLLVSGETKLFIANLTAVIAVTAFTAITTYALIKLVNSITPIRVTEEQEEVGLDVSVHGEVSRFHDRRSYQ
jgi:Amt family ammonium transporter